MIKFEIIFFGLYGAFLSYIGFHYDTWQFWVLSFFMFISNLSGFLHGLGRGRL